MTARLVLPGSAPAQQGPALTSSALPGHVIVSCARCGQDWPEGDPGVRYASGDFWCNWESECDDRMAAAQPITAAWRARVAADPNPERLQGAHDGQ